MHYGLNRRGFTLVEVMVGVVALGAWAVMIATAAQHMSEIQLRATSDTRMHAIIGEIYNLTTNELTCRNALVLYPDSGNLLVPADVTAPLYVNTLGAFPAGRTQIPVIWDNATKLPLYSANQGNLPALYPTSKFGNYLIARIEMRNISALLLAPQPSVGIDIALGGADLVVVFRKFDPTGALILDANNPRGVPPGFFEIESRRMRVTIGVQQSTGGGGAGRIITCYPFDPARINPLLAPTNGASGPKTKLLIDPAGGIERGVFPSCNTGEWPATNGITFRCATGAHCGAAVPPWTNVNGFFTSLTSNAANTSSVYGNACCTTGNWGITPPYADCPPPY